MTKDKGNAADDRFPATCSSFVGRLAVPLRLGHSKARRREKSGNPIGKKNVEFARLLCIAVGNKNQSFPVGAEHGERVEPLMEADPFKTGTILIDQKEIEFPASWLMEI